MLIALQALVYFVIIVFLLWIVFGPARWIACASMGHPRGKSGRCFCHLFKDER